MKTQTLALLAGLLWLIAGINVCKIGMETWLELEGTTSSNTLMLIIGCVLTLAAFSMMFVKMVFKNIRRIQQIEAPKRRVWDMMSVRSYIIMAFMITLGITLRHSPAIPPAFIASFYTGLGTALSLAGITYFLQLFTIND